MRNDLTLFGRRDRVEISPFSIQSTIDKVAEGPAICDRSEGGVDSSRTDSMDSGGMLSDEVGMLGGEVTSSMPKKHVVSSISVIFGT